MVDVLALANQLLARYKEALGELLNVLLPALVVRVHACLGPAWDWSGKMATPAAAMAPSADGAAGGWVRWMGDVGAAPACGSSGLV